MRRVLDPQGNLVTHSPVQGQEASVVASSGIPDRARVLHQHSDRLA